MVDADTQVVEEGGRLSEGPYIVKTRSVRIGQSAQVRNMRGAFVLSRRAVATLDEARMHVWRTVSLQAAYAVSALPESGGTVGPLPDGTVIEVEATTWVQLCLDADLPVRTYVAWPADEVPEANKQRILDAYNAKQKEKV